MSINIEVFIPLLGIYELDGWFKYRNFVHIHNPDDLNEISKLCTASIVVIDLHVFIYLWPTAVILFILCLGISKD